MLSSLIQTRQRKLEISFEFLPPKTPESESLFWDAVHTLAPLHPNFISVTHGAGGSSHGQIKDLLVSLQEKTGVKAAAHLTCIGKTHAETDALARQYWDAGIQHIIALRGDPRHGTLRPDVPDSYRYAADLVAGLKKIAPFEITVAGHPDTHPDAVSAEDDILNLKKKVDAGADRVVSQFFMDTNSFLKFRDRAVAAGIAVPIIPGILPITDFHKTASFAKLCNVKIPEHLHHRFNIPETDTRTREQAAITYATEQCRHLHTEGLRQFHFFTMNRGALVREICHAIHMSTH